ncbi:hypothetical protein [Glutamicibacter sp.]|jgi:hypothetical protein|uniref:hypothetical protein n=1 Tax=Glutamicibacter sp. TaxID=1931995 RepID=UPI002B489A8D|nr:hypothetical protein [Glutamicibacter sp.]HJX78718.1 hypothetical protein [Glutamicibacter sp.]
MSAGLQAVAIGGLSRSALKLKLRGREIQLNEFANQLVQHPVFDHMEAPLVKKFATRRLADLGLNDGASLADVFSAARRHALSLCPVTAGPYLRLAYREQPTSKHSVLNVGKAPESSLTVASVALGDDDFPKGFYLRTVDGQQWLRGYRCTDEHRFSPNDHFIFVAGS